MSAIKARIQVLLRDNESWKFAVYCILFSFSTYFCMYAFRKPFSVGKFEGSLALGPLGDVDWKIAFIIAQVIGYTLSKFAGIKIVSESRFASRGKQIVLLIAGAEVALLGFALAPPAWKILLLFVNGIPLGMIWGLVFGYLEGRRLTTLFGAALSVSFIVSSGVVKSAGRMVLDAGFSEYWMPFVTGLIFLPPLWLCVWCLDQIPPPSAEEEKSRVKRQPMRKEHRRAFLARYWVAVTLLTGLYMVVTAYRDFRDNFAREIWDALGYAASPEIFSATEIPIAVIVLIALGGLVAIRDPKKSFRAMYALMAAGIAMIGAGTAAFQAGLIGPVFWMTLTGLGLFLAYVPFGCIFYDDLIAVTGFVGTAGFMIYVSDAFGYLGSVFLLLYKNFAQAEVPWLKFFIGFSYFTCFFCLAGLALAWLALGKREEKPGNVIVPPKLQTEA